MIERWYDLHGPHLLVRAETEALQERADAWMLPEGEPGEEAFVLTVEEGLPQPAPAGAPLLFDGMMPDKIHCRISETGSREHYHVPALYSLDLGPKDAILTVVPGGTRPLRNSVAFQAINAALGMGDQYFLHGAALLPPCREEAVIFVGESGAGKTTTTLSLLAAGFRLLTDDASILVREGGRHSVWGMALPLKVHRKSGDMLPWLKPLLTGEWNVEDEQPVTPEALSGLLSLNLPPRGVWPVAAIVSLGPRSAEGHIVRPLAKADMLVSLAADNVARSLKGVNRQHQERMRRLAELVAAVPTFRLNAGPDLTLLPAAVLDALNASAGLIAAHSA